MAALHIQVFFCLEPACSCMSSYVCRRSTHKVPLETIRRMLNGYERFVSVQSIMGSQMPELKQPLPLDNRGLQ